MPQSYAWAAAVRGRGHPVWSLSFVCVREGSGPREVLLQWMPKIDMAGQRVGFFSVDQDLDARDRGQVYRDRVDDRVRREELVEGASGMFRPHVAAQVDKCLTSIRIWTRVIAGRFTVIALTIAYVVKSSSRAPPGCFARTSPLKSTNASPRSGSGRA